MEYIFYHALVNRLHVRGWAQEAKFVDLTLNVKPLMPWCWPFALRAGPSWEVMPHSVHPDLAVTAASIVQQLVSVELMINVRATTTVLGSVPLLAAVSIRAS